MSKKNLEVLNAEIAKQEIEQGKELSNREKVSAYLALHAAEHYALACGDVEQEEVDELLNNIKKEDGIYWLFTCPVIGGNNSKTGKPNPTKEEWEKLNPDAVRVDNLAGRQWYKKPKTLNDATDIVNLVNGWNRYNDAIEGAEKKVESTLAAAAAILGISVDELKAMKGIK